MDTRHLARMLELARDGRLSDEQIVALRDLLAADPDAKAWWRNALVFDRQLMPALETWLEGASMPDAARDRVRAQLQAPPARAMLQRVAPVLLALSMILCVLTVVRVWSDTMSGIRPPGQNQQPAATLIVLTPVSTPSVTPATFAVPTPTAFTPAEAATARQATVPAYPAPAEQHTPGTAAAETATSEAATATMAQLLFPNETHGPGTSETATMLRATDYAETATAEQMDPATVASITAEAQTATALAPFLPATQTAQVPTDLAATVVGMRATNVAETATAEQMDPAAAATATAEAQTATALAPFLPATQTAQVPTDLAATVVQQTSEVQTPTAGAAETPTPTPPGSPEAATATVPAALSYPPPP